MIYTPLYFSANWHTSLLLSFVRYNFLICTSAWKSSSFVLFRFFFPVSLLYHIGFLKIDLKMVNANDSKFTQITLSLPKCSYKRRNLNVYSWPCHRIFAPEQFVNTYVILYYFVFLYFWEVLVSIFLFCYIFVFCSLCPLCHNRFFRIGFLFSERKRYERLLNVHKHHFRNRISFNCS